MVADCLRNAAANFHGRSRDGLPDIQRSRVKESFFRKEVLPGTDKTAASIPVAPISWTMLGVALVVATTALLIFLVTAGYARKETASGTLISTAGVVRVSARSGGVVTGLVIREGDHVQAG